MIRVVLDTNVFLVGCLPRHRYAWITDALIQRKYELGVSNEILLEYQEKIAEKLGHDFLEETVDVIIDFSNVLLTDPRYKWRMIETDPDDNKFVDCAVAVRADYIVTEDKHFRETLEVAFPKVTVISLDEFGKLLGR